MAAVTEPAPAAGPARGPLSPEPYRVVGRRIEVADVVTLTIEPCRSHPPAFSHGQFNMITAYGVGEVALSICGAPGGPGPIEHSVRDVGAVTHALCNAQVGATLGVRGPFGTNWGTAEVGDGTDVVVVAGGTGLASLRGAVQELIDRRSWTGQVEGKGKGMGRVFVLVGARSPGQILFADQLEEWRRSGAHVAVTVDLGAPGWSGPVGVVTSLLPEARFDPLRSVALACGPEIMMRFAARALIDRGVDSRRIWVSLERNMQCGVGLCGHCQLGPILVCRDGPVVRYGGLAEQLLMERRL